MFVSYSSDDRPTAQAVAADLIVAGLTSWHDERVPGGAAWWDEILDQLESCELLVFVASKRSARSRWCRTEIDYADALGKPILPLLVDDVDAQDLPAPAASQQAIDYASDPGTGRVRLTAAALALIHAPDDPPVPMPARPPAPLPDLDPIRADIRAERLDADTQAQVLERLRALAGDPDLGGKVRGLLDELARRDDVVRRVSDEIPGLLGRTSHAAHGARRRHDGTDLLITLATQIRSENCTPVIGFGVTDRLAGSRRDVARHLAGRHNFALADHLGTDLAHVAQFLAVMYDDETMRHEVASALTRRLDAAPAGEPDDHQPGREPWQGFESALRRTWVDRRRHAAEADPIETVASLPCKVFVNAHPTSLLADAAREQGKTPRVVLCRWRPDARSDRFLGLQLPEPSGGVADQRGTVELSRSGPRARGRRGNHTPPPILAQNTLSIFVLRLHEIVAEPGADDEGCLSCWRSAGSGTLESVFAQQTGLQT